MTSLTAAKGQRSSSAALKRILKLVVLPLVIFVPLGYLLPKTLLLLGICGAYDVARNRKLNVELVRRYFLGNGIGSWLLSPFNAAMDILTLPYLNKGVYALEDLPIGHQEELRRVIETAKRENLVGQVEKHVKQLPRSMIFFKWYGLNIDGFLKIPAFQQRWTYVQTIGVSVFNRKSSTSRHFGPLRATLRVLYNINDIKDPSAFIVVGDKVNYWRDSKLFIFDDTLMHQSFNETEEARYCLFIDINRPSRINGVMTAIVRLICLVTRPFNQRFYRNWKVLQR
jgi:beta-hydroxylase